MPGDAGPGGGALCHVCVERAGRNRIVFRRIPDCGANTMRIGPRWKMGKPDAECERQLRIHFPLVRCIKFKGVEIQVGRRIRVSLGITACAADQEVGHRVSHAGGAGICKRDVPGCWIRAIAGRCLIWNAPFVAIEEDISVRLASERDIVVSGLLCVDARLDGVRAIDLGEVVSHIPGRLSEVFAVSRHITKGKVGNADPLP